MKTEELINLLTDAVSEHTDNIISKKQLKYYIEKLDIVNPIENIFDSAVHDISKELNILFRYPI